MNVEILQLIDGAKHARGLTVVIDVFRAFSVACYVMGNKAQQIIPVGDIEAAYTLKRENPGFVLIGERQGRKQPGFDYGNSPTHIEHVDFSGKTVVQTTSAGTQGIGNATGAEEIITGSFVNANAVIEYIKQREPEYVSLVCMGHEALEPSDEDTFFAEYIKNALEGKPNDFGEIAEKLKNGRARRFFDPANREWSPETDFYLCMSLDRFGFVLKAENYGNGLTALKKIQIY